MTPPPATRGLRAARALLAAYWLTLALATHWPRVRIIPPVADMPVDKMVHALAFGLLAGLLRLALPSARWWLAALIGLLYVPLDEYTQGLVGRTVDHSDTIAGLVGVAIVALLLVPRRGRRGDIDDGRSGFVGHAAIVAALTFASRFTGLVRDAAVVALLGQTTISSAFYLGFSVPNLFRRLFGEGALTAAFIPHYTDLARRDPVLARRFATQCLFGLLTVTLAITVAGELLMGAWLIYGRPQESTRLALALTMAMLPYMPMICATALAGGALQVHRRFASPAAAPILLNAVMIGFAFWGWIVWGTGNDLGIAWMLAMGVGAAGIMQLLWQLAAMHHGVGFEPGLRGTGEAVRGMVTMMLPMLVGLAVFQINTLLDSLIAFGFSPGDEAPPGAAMHVLGRTIAYPIESGAVTALVNAQRLYQFPLGVFSIAIATAIFPALARAAAGPGDQPADDAGAFDRILRQGLRLSFFIGLPAGVGLVVLREPIVQLFFQRGRFTADDTARTATIMACYSLGVWAYSMTHVLTRAFHARKDARTPLRISLAMVALNFVTNVLLIWPLGAAGLAVSTAVSGSVQAVLLMNALRRRGSRIWSADVAAGTARTVILSGAMGAAVWAATAWLHDGSTLGAAAAVGVGVVGGAAIVLGGALLTGAPEVRWLWRRRVAG